MPDSSTGLNPPATPQDLFNLLEKLGIPYKLHHHPPIFTVEEGEHLKASIPGTHCRNLFLADKKKVMYLVVAANETAIDLKKLANLINSGRLSFGSSDRLWQYLGIKPGSVCPFTAMNDPAHHVNVILDAGMMRSDIVCYHPLDNAMTIALSPADLLRFLGFTGHKPSIIDLTQAVPNPT